jgi:hypothetical protein
MLREMDRAERSADECRLWSDLHAPQLAINLRGAEHVTPSDAVWLAKGAIKAGTMGPDKALAAIREYVAAFLDAALSGKSIAPRLARSSLDYPDAIVTTQRQSLCEEISGQ